MSVTMNRAERRAKARQNFKTRTEVIGVDVRGRVVFHKSRWTKSPLTHRRAKRRAG